MNIIKCVMLHENQLRTLQ